jgi:hypothetical protein
MACYLTQNILIENILKLARATSPYILNFMWGLFLKHSMLMDRTHHTFDFVKTG